MPLENGAQVQRFPNARLGSGACSTVFIGLCQIENKHGPRSEVLKKLNMFLRKTLLYSENIPFLFYRSEMPLKGKMIVYIDRNGDFLVKVLYLVKGAVSNSR